MIERRGGYVVPDSLIERVRAQGATCYDPWTYEWYFRVYRPRYWRRWILFGPKRFTGWEQRTYQSVMSHSGGERTWLPITDWEYPLRQPGGEAFQGTRSTVRLGHYGRGALSQGNVHVTCKGRPDVLHAVLSVVAPRLPSSDVR